MGFLQQFNLVIKYKKGILNKVSYMFSRPLVNASTILEHNSLARESFVEQYARDNDFKDVYGNLHEELDYHVHDNLLYHLGNIFIHRYEIED